MEVNEKEASNAELSFSDQAIKESELHEQSSVDGFEPQENEENTRSNELDQPERAVTGCGATVLGWSHTCCFWKVIKRCSGGWEYRCYYCVTIVSHGRCTSCTTRKVTCRWIQRRNPTRSPQTKKPALSTN